MLGEIVQDLVQKLVLFLLGLDSERRQESRQLGYRKLFESPRLSRCLGLVQIQVDFGLFG